MTGDLRLDVFEKWPVCLGAFAQALKPLALPALFGTTEVVP